jgi:hypothetical protein
LTRDESRTSEEWTGSQVGVNGRRTFHARWVTSREARERPFVA